MQDDEAYHKRSGSREGLHILEIPNSSTFEAEKEHRPREWSKGRPMKNQITMDKVLQIFSFFGFCFCFFFLESHLSVG